MGNKLDKRFSFTVDTAQTSYNKKFLLDKNVVMVWGLLVSSSHPDQLFFRGSQRIEINGVEIFEEDFESKILMSGLSVPPDNKFRSFEEGIIPGNGEIKLLYKDEERVVAFTPYIVSIILKCEIK